MSQNKSPHLERTGTVVESLPNTMFRVRLDPSVQDLSSETNLPAGSTPLGGDEVLSYLSGRMRLHRIRVLVGDRVILELEPYGGKARITKRL